MSLACFRGPTPPWHLFPALLIFLPIAIFPNNPCRGCTIQRQEGLAVVGSGRRWYSFIVQVLNNKKKMEKKTKKEKRKPVWGWDNLFSGGS